MIREFENPADELRQGTEVKRNAEKPFEQKTISVENR